MGQDSYKELQFQNTAKTIVVDKLDLSSTTTSCDEGISNVSRDDSPKHKKIPQSKTKNGRKRKNEQNGDEKHSESKKNKKQKGSHLRKNIKNILDADALQAEAKAAKAEEQERLKRLHDAQLAQKNILLNQRTNQHPPQQIVQKAIKERNDEIINISSSSGEESKNNE